MWLISVLKFGRYPCIIIRHHRCQNACQLSTHLNIIKQTEWREIWLLSVLKSGRQDLSIIARMTDAEMPDKFQYNQTQAIKLVYLNAINFCVDIWQASRHHSSVSRMQSPQLPDKSQHNQTQSITLVFWNMINFCFDICASSTCGAL